MTAEYDIYVAIESLIRAVIQSHAAILTNIFLPEIIRVYRFLDFLPYRTILNHTICRPKTPEISAANAGETKGDESCSVSLSLCR